MNTSEQLMRDLAARNPIHDGDIRDSTGGQRGSMAQAWSDAGADDATSSGVLARRNTSPHQAGRGGLLLVAASVAVLIGGTAAVTSGVADPVVDWVAGEDTETSDRVTPEDLYEPDALTHADLSGISDAQAVEIVDRVATEEEYHAAYERFRQCMSAGGFNLPEDPVVNPDGTLLYTVPGEAVDSGVDQECYDREFHYTDMLWQITPGVQNHPSRTQWMRDCLQERGIDPQDTAAELDEQLRQEGIQPPDCLQ